MDYQPLDLVGYLFTPEILKFGVVCNEQPTAGAISVYCLNKDQDGFWQFKPDLPQYATPANTILMKINSRSTTLGKEYLVDSTHPAEKSFQESQVHDP